MYNGKDYQHTFFTTKITKLYETDKPFFHLWKMHNIVIIAMGLQSCNEV